MEEAELVRLCQRGEAAAFEAFFSRYARRVLQSAYLITGDRAVAEEVMQETFVQTFRTIGQVREPAAFSAWLARVTIRLARHHLNRLRTEQQAAARLTAEFGGISPAPDCAVETRESVWAAIERLPERYREVLVLHYFEDRPVAEVAASWASRRERSSHGSTGREPCWRPSWEIPS